MHGSKTFTIPCNIVYDSTCTCIHFVSSCFYYSLPFLFSNLKQYYRVRLAKILAQHVSQSVHTPTPLEKTSLIYSHCAE